MNPNVPKPPKGSGDISSSRSLTYLVDTWEYNSSGYMWKHTSEPYTTPMNRVEWFSRVRGRKATVPRILTPYENKWRPCTGYALVAGRTSWPSGEQTFVRTEDGKPALKLTGPSGAYEPFSNGSIFIDALGFPLPISANTYNRLAVEVMQKVGARKTSYGESLGEAKTTAQHLAKTAIVLGRAYKAARKGNFGQVANLLRVNPKRFKPSLSASERWLEYQYGWMPLMNDIYDSHKLITEGFRKKAMTMSSVRRISSFDERRSSSQRLEDSPWTVMSKRTDFMKVYYRVDDTSAARIHQMGLINPLEVAWAITPWSFVVDWFLPVGNFLEALTAGLGTSFIDGCYGTVVESKYTVKPYDGDKWGARIQSNSQSVEREIFSFDRGALTGYPSPMLYLKDPFSSTHITSAMALIRSLAK